MKVRVFLHLPSRPGNNGGGDQKSFSGTRQVLALPLLLQGFDCVLNCGVATVHPAIRAARVAFPPPADDGPRSCGEAAAEAAAVRWATASGGRLWSDYVLARRRGGAAAGTGWGPDAGVGWVPTDWLIEAAVHRKRC
jgi:hypothetical protein